jgi:hypothetical protein
MRELLFQERKLLDSAAAPDFPRENAFETQHSALLASYLKAKPDVDAAVTVFSQTLEWPDMKPLEKFFVVARIDFAWEVASILNTARNGECLIAYPCPDTCSTAELLQWLLIEIWPYGCGKFLETQKWVTNQVRAARAAHTAPPHELAKAKCVAYG